MGFNKSHIDKHNILFHLKNKDLTSTIREMKINQLFNADALVMDMWTSRFYNDLRPEERKMRKDLYERYKFNSGYEFIKDGNFINLKSFSECLLSLVNNPTWYDIIFTINNLKLNISEDESGRFNILKDKCINALIDYFDHG